MLEDHITEDIGNIEQIDNNNWMEHHPNGDYEEKWERVADAENMRAAISTDY